MPFVTQGKTNLKYILIVVVLAAIAGGGILGYQYWWVPKHETKIPEVKLPEVKPPEEATKGESPKIEENKNIVKGEIVDQLTTDLKGTGKLQKVELIKAKPEGAADNYSEDYVEFNYFVRIYTDETDKVIEWDGPSVPSGLAPGNLLTEQNPATGHLTIEHFEGAGAHGMNTQFIHWTGSKFEEIKAVDENGKEIPDAFFGDGGGALLNSDGTISVGFRNYNCPLSGEAGIENIYKWNEASYQFEKTETYPCPAE